MLKLLCKVGSHHGTWVHVPESCDQVRIYQRCDKESSRVSHDVRVWQSDESIIGREFGLCVRCEEWQSRMDRYIDSYHE